MAQAVQPYGTWPSPITAASIASGVVTFGAVACSRAGVWWEENRPSEGGRVVVVRRAPDGTVADAVPADVNVRTRVHEYGGGSFFVDGSTLYFSNWADQRLYRLEAGGEPVPITPEPDRPACLRYADGVTTPDGRFVVCVRELHPAAGEPVNEIVILPADGSLEPRVVATGNDFYSFPRVSPDGTRLAFTTWNHPNMPWDGTELWVAHLDRDGSLADPVHVAGGDNESVFQPQWSPDGVLHFVSDRRGWWNLYRLAGDRAEAVWEPDADLGAPQWVFGLSTYAFLSDGTIACARTERGSSSLVVLADGVPRDLGFGFGRGIHLSSDGQRLAFVAASPTRMPAVMLVDPRTAEADVLQRAASSELDERYVSVPETVEFPTEGGRTAHAWFYPPRNEDVEAPPEERPPLLVFSHGGPTGHVTNVLSPSIQFWTSRGFAVVDVNYGGSTGYGRAYRERLKRNWGVVDVDDCTAAARRLAGRGAVDADRLAIRGGSAGGYTTLAALAFRPGVFKAGANHFGVADLGMLARDTHKFESRYLDSLVGPYPETKDVYDARSPLVHADRIRTPLITLQGLEDVVVPPAQSEAIVEALRRNGVPCAYVPFPGEQHGFRRAENIARALEAELYFYGRVLGFEPADAIEPVEIENL